MASSIDRIRRRITSSLTLIAFATGSIGWAEPSQPAASPAKTPFEREESQIPRKPTAPPPLYQQPSSDFLRCQRTFSFQGRTYGCDSNIRLDGEKLRPVIAEIPAAVAELNTYQENRAHLRNAAYVGTAGFVLILSGILVSALSKDQAGNTSEFGGTFRTATLFSGWGLIGGSFLFSLSAIRANEVHLENAVRLYNDKHPDKPIELQFSTGLKF